MATERHHTMTTYVSDMLAVTKHVHEAIERQLHDDRVKSDSTVHPLLSKLDGVLESQIAAQESQLKSIGGDPGSPIKDAVTSTLGVAAGLIDKVRGDTVSKMLRDDYTALSLMAMALTMLHTTGLALKHEPTANLALDQLKQITPILVDISEKIPLVVLKELRDDSEIVDESAGQRAVKNTQQAWSRDVVE